LVALLCLGHARGERPDRPEGVFRHHDILTQKLHQRHRETQPADEAAKDAGVSPEQLEKAKAQLKNVEAEVHKAKHENQTENQTGHHTESAAAGSVAGHHGEETDPQVQMATEMLEAARKALHFAREAHSLKATEVTDRVKLEDAVNISREANETYEKMFADYQAATNHSSQLHIELLEAKQAMVEATQLAGSTQSELDSVLQQWAAANASAAETLGLLQSAQHTFAETNQSLADAKASLETAQLEEKEAKEETVAQAEQVLKAIQGAPADDYAPAGAPADD